MFEGSGLDPLRLAYVAVAIDTFRPQMLLLM